MKKKSKKTVKSKNVKDNAYKAKESLVIHRVGMLAVQITKAIMRREGTPVAIEVDIIWK